MNSKLMMPIGYENFKELRNNNFYYIDKTKLIERLIENYGKVNIITRPHRFGKTLNMSMLRYFFEIGTDTNLMLGILTGNENWLVKSNVEAGEGFADIIVETDDPDAGIILELKFTKDISEMEGLCQKALKQIDDKRYFEFLLNQDRTNVLLYEMCFCKKRCKVIAKKLEK